MKTPRRATVAAGAQGASEAISTGRESLVRVIFPVGWDGGNLTLEEQTPIHNGTQSWVPLRNMDGTVYTITGAANIATIIPPGDLHELGVFRFRATGSPAAPRDIYFTLSNL